MHEIKERVERLEISMGAVLSQLKEQSVQLAEHVKTSNRIADTVETIVSNALDAQSGVVPASMMRIDDHKTIVESVIDGHSKERSRFLWAFVGIVCLALGTNAAVNRLWSNDSLKRVNEELEKVVAEKVR